MQDKRSFFSQIFIALMIFSGLVGICAVAFITSWPWEKNAPAWQPQFRLAVTCAEPKETCGIAYGDLAEAKAAGKLASLEAAEPAGDLEEPMNWLKWKKENGVYEVKASSWHFQTTVRYTIENDMPVIIAHQDVDVSRAFTYAIGAAIFMMVGLNLRKLRG